MSSNKISVAEYEEMGKITTRKALEELQKTMEMRNADKSIDSDSESDYELENNIVSEISRSDRNINRIVKNNSLSIPSNSDDRAMCMFNNLYNKVRTHLRYFNSEPEAYEVIVDDDFEYTDEIEKALWDIKECLDLPTEEIEIAVATRHSSLKKS